MDIEMFELMEDLKVTLEGLSTEAHLRLLTTAMTAFVLTIALVPAERRKEPQDLLKRLLVAMPDDSSREILNILKHATRVW